MLDWQPEPKGYSHFDGHMPISAAVDLATDPTLVASHAFYPFIRYHQRWTKYANKGLAGKVKERPIRYAARADAYIFSYYRHILGAAYEARLTRGSLSANVLAYRRLVDSHGHGKCNIHFALDAVNCIRAFGNCCVIALDISNFFESLDHAVLKRAWCDTLGLDRLPPDHHQVFKAITAYSVVDKELVYERLGFYGTKGYTRLGVEIKGYLKSPKDIPIKLTTGATFRNLVAGGNGSPSLIIKNRRPYGIPQGAPISDLLANLYLYEFDLLVRDRAASFGGTYYRYSDDILIIVPTSTDNSTALEAWVRATIRAFGSKLQIKAEKSALFKFEPLGKGQSCTRVMGHQGKNGVEYLGFRYDGEHMFLRDSTLSGFQRKITRSAKRAAHFEAKRYPTKSAKEIFGLFDVNKFIQRYGRVEDFEDKAQDVRNWTFWTYVTRAGEVLGPMGLPIFRQLRHQRRVIKERIQRALDNAVMWRDRS